MHSCQKETFLNLIPGDSKIKAKNRLNWTSRKSSVHLMRGSSGAPVSSARLLAVGSRACRLLQCELRNRYANHWKCCIILLEWTFYIRKTFHFLLRSYWWKEKCNELFVVFVDEVVRLKVSDPPSIFLRPESLRQHSRDSRSVLLSWCKVIKWLSNSLSCWYLFYQNSMKTCLDI